MEDCADIICNIMKTLMRLLRNYPTFATNRIRPKPTIWIWLNSIGLECGIYITSREKKAQYPSRQHQNKRRLADEKCANVFCIPLKCLLPSLTVQSAPQSLPLEFNLKWNPVKPVEISRNPATSIKKYPNESI